MQRTWFLGGMVFCLILPLISLNSSASYSSRDQRQPDRHEPVSDEEDTEGRDDWFTYQRSYPFNSIPIEARRNAWRGISRFEADSLRPAASNRWTAIGPAPTTPFYL